MDIDVEGDAALVRGRPLLGIVASVSIGHLVLARLSSSWRVEGLAAEPVWLAIGLTSAGALLVRRERRPFVVAGGLAAQVVHGLIERHSAIDLVGDLLATAVELIAAVLVFAAVFDRARGRGFHVTTTLAFGAAVAVAALGGIVAGVWFADDTTSFGAWFWSWSLGHAIGMVTVGATVMLFREVRGWRVDVAERGSHAERVTTIVGSVVVTLIVFANDLPLAPVVVVPLAWLAVRFGPAVSFPGSVVAIALTSSLTAADNGPLVGLDEPAVALHAVNWALAFAGVFIGRYSRFVDFGRLREAAMVAALPDPVAIVTRDGVVVDRLATDLTDETARQMQTASIELRDRAFDARIEALNSSHTVNREFLLDDGRTIELRLVAMDDDHVLSMARDVSEAVALRDRLRRATRHWQRLASTAYEGFAEVDASARVTYASDRWAEMLGVDDPKSLRGVLFSEMFRPDEWHRFEPHATRVLSGERTAFEEEMTTADGRSMWVLVSADPTIDEQGRFSGCVLFAADTTEHHREQERRAAAEAELASLERRERQRIARVLHDGPLQIAVALSYRLNGRATADPTLEPLEAMALAAIRQMRGTLDDLTPPAVHDGQLTAALVGIAERYRSGGGPSFDVDDLTSPPLAPTTAGAVFRIGREAIANAMVHADATSVHVRLRHLDDGVEIVITDDGVGFDPDSPVEGHLGLGLMHDRATELGGWCRLESSGAGTSVTAWVPDVDPWDDGDHGG